MADKFAVGVDFGGTKISAGVVNVNTGQLVSVGKKKTRQVSEQEDVLKRITAVIDEALLASEIDLKKISSIGIGAAGQVNRQKGILIDAANIGVQDLALAEPISAHYQIPTYLGNDVEVATLGEKNFGAGRDCSSFVCVFVGTGIGSGIVHNGELYLGSSGTAGEIGHMTLFPDGRPCGCGAFGCLETYASRTALAKCILSDLQRGIDSVVRDKVDMTKGILRAKAIASAVEAGDELVIQNVVSCARYFGMGIASVVNFYNPQRFIIGGGLVDAVDLYLEVAIKEAHRRALRTPSKKLDMVKAELGDYAGIIGAALLSRTGTPALNTV
jgi:glucokinase